MRCRSLMNTKGIKPNKLPYTGENISSEEMEALRRQVYELQLEGDILKKTIYDCNKLTVTGRLI